MHGGAARSHRLGRIRRARGGRVRPDTQAWLEDTRDFWAYFFRNFWRVRDVKRHFQESREPGARAWAEMSTMLTALTADADLIITGVSYEELAVNVADYHDIPLATLLWFPIRVNGHLVPKLPAPVTRARDEGLRVVVGWPEEGQDAQRRELAAAAGQRAGIAAHRRAPALEIQAYDDVCFPGLAAEWQSWGEQRPFVGTLTQELATEADDDVASWIAAGSPPICSDSAAFLLAVAAEMLAMIASVCAQLGERALLCAGWTDFSSAPQFDHVKWSAR